MAVLSILTDIGKKLINHAIDQYLGKVQKQGGLKQFMIQLEEVMRNTINQSFENYIQVDISSKIDSTWDLFGSLVSSGNMELFDNVLVKSTELFYDIYHKMGYKGIAEFGNSLCLLVWVNKYGCYHGKVNIHYYKTKMVNEYLPKFTELYDQYRTHLIQMNIPKITSGFNPGPPMFNYITFKYVVFKGTNKEKVFSASNRDTPFVGYDKVKACREKCKDYFCLEHPELSELLNLYNSLNVAAIHFQDINSGSSLKV